MALIELKKEKISIIFAVVFLFSLLIVLGSAVNTAPVDVNVFKGNAGVNNASVWVDGQYRGETTNGGHLFITNLTVSYHTVNAQYEDNSGKYVGNSGFENIPGITNAKVYLQRIK